ncbi:MAG: DUF2764 domain-containing protein [Prevotellaceae bacterium]|jgi:hypothetical protein|nr:DUF2764 domain-containing protein [Prevotellaceae bacterium]
MSNYYYLVAGLPELSPDDNKLARTIADFRMELYPFLTTEDKRLVDLFYLQYDNANVLKRLRDKDALIDERGNYTSDELTDALFCLKDGDAANTYRRWPEYLKTFIREYHQTGTDTPVYLLENRLAAGYYVYGRQCRNEFVAAWFAFNEDLNNVLTALTARKYKLSLSEYVVGEGAIAEVLRTSQARDFGILNEVDRFEELLKISESEPMERERRIDLLRWRWLEEHTVFKYFSVERLFVFLLQTSILERWTALDKQTGGEKFREILNDLKREVQVPAEFRKQ